MGRYLSFPILVAIKLLSMFFYRLDGGGVDGGPIPGRPWRQVRLICFLNHTSLYEPIFAAVVPFRFLWEIASRAVVPVAAKTLERPLVGFFFKLLIPHPVSISRAPDHTWEAVLNSIDADSLVIILPEGRMRRATGLDLAGKPMTARGGVADILRTIDDGKMLMAYSGGLHHVQIPGQRLPRVFRRLRMRFELLDIATYREQMTALAEGGDGGFKNAVKKDLDRRRDELSPWTPETTRQPSEADLAAAASERSANPS